MPALIAGVLCRYITAIIYFVLRSSPVLNCPPIPGCPEFNGNALRRSFTIDGVGREVSSGVSLELTHPSCRQRTHLRDNATATRKISLEIQSAQSVNLHEIESNIEISRGNIWKKFTYILLFLNHHFK